MNRTNFLSGVIFLFSVALQWYGLFIVMLCVRIVASERDWKRDLFKIAKFIKQFTAREKSPSWNYTAPDNSANTDVCLLIMRHLNDPRTARLVCKKMSKDVILMGQWYQKRAVHLAHYAKYWMPNVCRLPDSNLASSALEISIISSAFGLHFKTFGEWNSVWVCFHLEPTHLVRVPNKIRDSDKPLLKLIAFTRHTLYFQKVDKELFQ